MRILLTFILLLGFSALVGGVDPETVKIMPFVSDPSYCARCHKGNSFPEPAWACKNYCITCHKENNRTHHKTDAPMKKKRPGIMATARGKITCRTCHNLKGNRYGKKSWKAESLYDSIFSKKKKYKTYYLIMRNNNGQLCKTCH